MEYSKIKTEIAKVEYEGMTSQQIYDDWQTTSPVTDAEIRITEIGMYDKLNPTVAETILQKLLAASQNAALAPLDKIVERALKWLEPAQGGIAPGNANTIALIDNLVTATVLTSEEGTALKALGTKPVTKAETLGLSGVEEKHIRWVMEGKR